MDSRFMIRVLSWAKEDPLGWHAFSWDQVAGDFATRSVTTGRQESRARVKFAYLAPPETKDEVAISGDPTVIGSGPLHPVFLAPVPRGDQGVLVAPLEAGGAGVAARPIAGKFLHVM